MSDGSSDLLFPTPQLLDPTSFINCTEMQPIGYGSEEKEYIQHLRETLESHRLTLVSKYAASSVLASHTQCSRGSTALPYIGLAVAGVDSVDEKNR